MNGEGEDQSTDSTIMPPGSPLDRYLGSAALANKGYAFEAAGQKYGVDPALLASIATFETGHGTSKAATQDNNVMGGMVPSSPNQKQHQKFDSVDDSIDKAASNLSRNYLQKGLTTIPQIGAVYSPVGIGGKAVANDPKDTNKDWPGGVQQIYTKMGGTKEFFGPQSVGVGVNMMGDYPQAPPPSPNWTPSPGEKPPPNAPPPVASANSDTDSFAATDQLGGHLGAVNA
jgi:hypothetical protein